MMTSTISGNIYKQRKNYTNAELTNILLPAPVPTGQNLVKAYFLAGTKSHTFPTPGQATTLSVHADSEHITLSPIVDDHIEGQVALNAQGRAQLTTIAHELRQFYTEFARTADNVRDNAVRMSVNEINNLYVALSGMMARASVYEHKITTVYAHTVNEWYLQRSVQFTLTMDGGPAIHIDGGQIRDVKDMVRGILRHRRIARPPTERANAEYERVVAEMGVDDANAGRILAGEIQGTRARVYTTDVAEYVNYDYDSEAIMGGHHEPLPYRNTTIGWETDCVWNYIVDRFITTAADTNRKSIKILRKYFPEGEPISLAKIRTWAESKHVYVLIYDIFATIRYESPASIELGDIKAHNAKAKKDGLPLERVPTSRYFVGIVFKQHFFPIMTANSRTLRPLLVKEPCDYSQHSAIKLTVNGRIISSAGVSQGEDQDSLDMELLRDLPLNFNYRSEENVKSVAISYSRPMTQKTADEHLARGNLVQQDMKKAYFNSLMAHKNGQIPLFSATSMWEKYDGGRIENLSMYLLEENPRYTSSSIMHGFLINVLIRGHVKVLITHVKHPASTFPAAIITDRLTKMMPVDEEEAKRFKKSFGIYNGILGKSRSRKVVTVSGLDDADIRRLIHFYQGRKGATLYTTDSGAATLTTKQHHRYMNHRNIYNLVVDLCSATVLRRCFSVGMKYVVKIHTDSITYTIPLPLSEGWRAEEPTLSGSIRSEGLSSCEAWMVSNVVDEIKSFSHGNYIITGAPGTGKTRFLTSELEFNHIATVSNICRVKLAADSGRPAKTVHSLFGMYNAGRMRPRLRSITGIIAIDEFSMLQPEHHSAIFAARSNGKCTQIILLGDPDQIPPVQAESLDIDGQFAKLFYPERIHKSTNYRNDPAVIELRGKVRETYHEQVSKEVRIELATLLRKASYTSLMDSDSPDVLRLKQLLAKTDTPWQVSGSLRVDKIFSGSLDIVKVIQDRYTHKVTLDLLYNAREVSNSNDLYRTFVEASNHHQMARIVDMTRAEMNSEYFREITLQKDTDTEWLFANPDIISCYKRHDRGTGNDRDVINSVETTLSSLEWTITLCRLVNTVDKRSKRYLDSDMIITHTKLARERYNREVLSHRNLSFDRRTVDVGVKLRAPVMIQLAHETPIQKGDLLTVIESAETFFVCKSIITGEKHTIPIKHQNRFALAFAVNVHLTQGLTVLGKVCVAEVDKMLHFSAKLLYTAVTRIRNLDTVQIIH